MSNAHLYVAVREAAAGTFDVLGELGPGPNGGVVYLARAIGGDALAILKLEPGPDSAGGTQYFLDVTQELDASVPDVEMHCPRCTAKLRQWARFCTQCGLDVSGEAPASGEHASRAALREQVRAATAGRYEFLGDIPRAEGGGLVYFARDLSNGRIVALRLQKDMNKKFEVGVTRMLKAVEREQALAADRAEAGRPALTIVQRSGPTRLSGTGGLTPTPRPVPAPNAGQLRAPVGSAKPAERPVVVVGRWPLGRTHVAVGVAIFVLLILALVLL
jgi:hypothetical protein